MIQILEYAVKMWGFHNTNSRLDQELWKAKIWEMKIVENFKTLTRLAIIDPNAIFDVDNNEDGRYSMVHRYDNIGSSVLQCILLC